MSHSIKVKVMRSHQHSLIMKKLFRIAKAHRAPLRVNPDHLRWQNNYRYRYKLGELELSKYK